MTKTNSNTPKKSMTKKIFQELSEVENFYKLIHKYNLREEAYRASLKSYIKIKGDRVKS